MRAAPAAQICFGSSPLTRGTPESRFYPPLPDPGSSPLTRGTHHPDAGARRLGRLIPAHAGNTGREKHRRCCAAAHPRSRGEHRVGGSLARAACGSSPLTRGTRSDHGHGPGRSRLIPAHAGNTQAYGHHPRAPRAHPRSRGEHGFHFSAFLSFPGSSPLTRGTPHRGQKPSRRNRLIPAHAGNTMSAMAFWKASAAHPRSRGEHWETFILDEASGGSSPLTRGTH